MRRLITALMILGFALPCWGATPIYVAVAGGGDYGAGNDANAGTTKALPKRHLQAAVNAVDAGGEVICNVETWEEDIGSLAFLYVAAAKTVTIKKDPGLSGTTKFHNTRNPGCVLYVPGTTVAAQTITFENMTLDGTYDTDRGTLQNDGPATNLVLTGCVVTNTAVANAGKCVGYENTASHVGNFTATNCTFQSGAQCLYLEGGGTFTLTNCSGSHTATVASPSAVLEVPTGRTIGSLIMSGGTWLQDVESGGTTGAAIGVYGTVTGLVELKGGLTARNTTTKNVEAIQIAGDCGSVHFDNITAFGEHSAAKIGAGPNLTSGTLSTLVENSTFDVSTANGQAGLGIQCDNAVVRYNTFLHGGSGEESLGVYRGVRDGRCYGNIFLTTGTGNAKGISLGGTGWDIHHNLFLGMIGIGCGGKHHHIHSNTFLVKSYAGAVGANKGCAIYTTDVNQAGNGTATGVYEDILTGATTITASTASFLSDYLGEFFQTAADGYAASYEIIGYISTTKILVAGDASGAAGAHRQVHKPRDNLITDNIFYADGTTLGGLNTMTCVYIYNNAANRNVFDRNLYWAPGDATLMYFGADQDTEAAVQAQWETATNTVSYFNEQNMVIGDPRFMSTDPSNARFLQLGAGSAARGTQTGTPSLATWGDLGAWQRRAGGGDIHWR